MSRNMCILHHKLRNAKIYPLEVQIFLIKGVKKETWPLKILTNADFKVLYRKENFFLTTLVNFCYENLEFIDIAFFMEVKKK